MLDHGYHPEHLTIELKKIYPQIMTKIKFELSKKPSKQEKKTQGKSGFVPVVARWCESLARN
ncbi:transposase [Microcoleus sp. B9-D4]